MYTSVFTDGNGRAVNQLIRYLAGSSDSLKAIDTMSNYNFSNEAYKPIEDDEDRLTKYYEGEYTYKNDSNVRCFSDSSMGFNAAGGSVVFIIGNNASAANDDNYNIGIEYLANGTKYQLEVYDIDRGGSAGAIVCFMDNVSKDVNVSVSSALITKICEAVNSDGDIGYELTYYENSQYHTAFVNENIQPIKSSGKMLAPGDVVRLVVNDKSEVTQLAVDFDYETRRGDESASSYFNNEFAYLSYTWSSLFSYKNNYLLVSNTKDGDGNYNYVANNLQNYSMNNAKIVIYDTYSKTARAGSIQELRDYVTYGGEADVMLIRKCYYAPRLVIVYR